MFIGFALVTVTNCSIQAAPHTLRGFSIVEFEENSTEHKKETFLMNIRLLPLHRHNKSLGYPSLG